MFKLGLTGSIATGKSTAAQMFKDFGIPAYSADDAVHDLYANAAVEPVAKAFPKALDAQGNIDRQALSAQITGQPEKLAALESIVHPLVKLKFDQFLDHQRNQDAALVVLDVPLLFEGKNSYALDAIAVTFCAESEQRRRALLRPEMTSEKLETILKRQMPQAEKKARADFLIDTDLSRDQMRETIRAIIAACENRSKKP